ncbi:MAG: lipoyl-dependent peroxiredoxin [Solirubrobacteraceae bacterium]|nr:lipoyl-dependent peroxiredoxin [Solirubrobacteraceae bacterium]
MARNTANAKWIGSLKEGLGHIALGNGAFEGQFSFRSRFEDGDGTNPEELIAAAIAGCFSMQFSAFLHNDGIESESVETSAQVELRPVDGTPTITKITLTTTVTAPGAEAAKVRELGEAAKTKCPVSRALAGVEEMVLELTLA